MTNEGEKDPNNLMIGYFLPVYIYSIGAKNWLVNLIIYYSFIMNPQRDGDIPRQILFSTLTLHFSFNILTKYISLIFFSQFTYFGLIIIYKL